jgi:uncharacterized protein
VIKIGDFSTLEILKTVDFGMYLDGGPFGEILLPSKYIPENARVGDEIKVFLYNDSEDRLIATTEKPKAKVGEFAFLEVKAVSEYGAFLDWGLLKDLFVPFREQVVEMQVGNSYLVRVYLDEKTDRIAASSRWHLFLEEKNETLREEEEVEIKIATKTDLGYKVIVNDTYWGILYENEIFQPVSIGETKKAYVKKIREDKRIDIILHKQGVEEVVNSKDGLLAKLEANEGFLPLTDKSSPELIYQEMQMSKKAFKRAVGILYKQRLIVLEKDGIRLVDKK